LRRSVRPLRKSNRTTLLAAGAACLTAVLGLASPATAAPHPNPGYMAANTAAQIAALQQIKQTESASDRKVDSRLLVENKLRTDRSAHAALPQVQSGVKMAGGNTVLVDIRAIATSDALVDAVQKAGGQIKNISQREATVRAVLPLAAVSPLATRDDVKQIQPGSDAMTSASGAPGRNSADTDPVSKQTRDARVEQATKPGMRANLAAAVVSQGDRAHAADTARQQNGVTGVGAKLCALSDGVSSLAASVATGELPPVDVLPGQEGSGDEGTAMLEIMHDVAPGAALGFATAFNGDASFADNIRALRSQEHCDVIVDDVFYFNEAAFQDGPIAQAVNDVIADGALYFSSAGNEGNVGDGTAGHWEGNYVDSGQPIAKFAGGANNFAAATGGTQILEPLSASSGGVPVTLWWNDPLGHAADDYDLYLLDAGGNVVTFSQNIQNGTQDPYERINTTGGNQRLAVVKFKGDAKYLSLSALRGRFVDSSDGLKAYVTSGETSGHSATAGAFSVAAAPAADAFPRALEPGDPPNPAGPYPGTFSSATKIERFSSDGPRKIFFNADGTPVAGGSVIRQKPDITAADGVSTSVTGFSPFYGTSAAAPHAAAIAGLVLSGNPGMSNADVRQALTATAVDIGAPGVDNRTGAGVILADRVLAYTGASPQPLAVAQAPSVKGPNGSPFVKPGDTATVTLPVYNGGDGTAASTSVVVDSPTPGVTIAPRSKRYGTIEAGQTVINSFTLTVPATQQLGVPVVINAKVTFAGAHSPTTQTFQIPIGQPSTVVQDFAYAGAPVAIPDNSAVGASVQIPVTGVGRASKITFSIDGTSCSTAAGSTTVGLDHTYAGDLTGTLTSPSGATAVLFQRRGGPGHNFCQVVFDDNAATAFSSVSSANAPFTGSWKPQSGLGLLLTDPVDGTWTFKVVDGGPVDTGSIRAVSLHLNGFVA
jgi:subtilisin-like proprotein convertase family protein